MTEPVWITKTVALAIHEELLTEHGGLPGLRDEPLLESALTRPRQLFSYNCDASLFTLAAAYVNGLLPNHPFADGNKRTAFVLGGIFLERNGQVLNALEEESAAMVLALASKTITEEDFSLWLEKNSFPLSRYHPP
jgi:death on curing protein